MNGNLTPELVADRIADLERSATRVHRAAPRRAASVRRSLGHFLVFVGTKLEGRAGVVGGDAVSRDVAGVVIR